MLFHFAVDPVALTAGPLSIRWYGLLFVGAFLLGQAMLARMFRSEGVEVDPKCAERLLLLALLGTIVGARLAHCLFYEPQYYLANPWAILRIWEGGLASHGGVLGLLCGLWLGRCTMLQRRSFLWLLDRVAIPAVLGAALVRIANFLNAEILGVPTSGNWGVVMDAVDSVPRHPVQLYEAAAYLLIGMMLRALYQRWGRRTPHGVLVGGFMLLVFSVRFALEYFKTPQAHDDAGQWLSMGQTLSLPFVLLGAALVLWSGYKRRVA